MHAVRLHGVQTVQSLCSQAVSF